MSGARRERILAQLVEAAPGREMERLCEVAARIVGVDGAAILLVTGDVPRGSVGASDDVSALLERLQFDLGEGPCMDAHAQDRPILEPDLATTPSRWPAFAEPAMAAGVWSVFGFPLRVGAARLGALNLHNQRTGALSDDQHADALVMADVAAHAVLLQQAAAPPGALAAELEAGGDFQYVVHQATGMVAAQLGVSVGHALVRLRAHAYANDRPLREVADDVVGRRLRLDPDA